MKSKKNNMTLEEKESTRIINSSNLEDIQIKDRNTIGDKVSVIVSINGTVVLDTNHIYVDINNPGDTNKIYPNGLNSPDEFRLMVEELGRLYYDFNFLLEDKEFMTCLEKNKNAGLKISAKLTN